ncbi:helix-turn-helix domain-containing protein [Streptosporangium canum]|uniref:helix-turn-helix domain-containing protein n=1 Tax=Streptosporangium canum TaxID=324952 RepID=UPI00343BFAF4
MITIQGAVQVMIRVAKVEMLWVRLSANRRTEDAAAALHVHPNTLAYRLRRFTALTGRDLSSTGAFAEVWLAVRAAGQLGLTD